MKKMMKEIENISLVRLLTLAIIGNMAERKYGMHKMRKLTKKNFTAHIYSWNPLVSLTRHLMQY